MYSSASLTPHIFYNLILALLRQNSTAWEAYFIVTDNAPFETELQVTLAQYEDSRLSYLPLEAKFRPEVSELCSLSSVCTVVLSGGSLFLRSFLDFYCVVVLLFACAGRLL